MLNEIDRNRMKRLWLRGTFSLVAFQWAVGGQQLPVSLAQTTETAAKTDASAESADSKKNDGEASVSAAELNLQSFDKVWSSIQETHWDPTLGGLDWEACRDGFRPSEEQAADINATRRAMAKMIAKLEQSHFVVIPADMYGNDDETPNQSGNGWAGIEYRFIDDGAVVASVVPDSPASRAGLEPGQLITSIEGKEILTPKMLIEKENVAERIALEVAYAKAAQSLGGPVGSERKLVLAKVDGETLETTLTLAEEPGDLVGFGNLPKMNLRIETKILEGSNVGYISLSIFLDPSQVFDKVSSFVKSNPELDGVIIDIRGNPGGIGAMAGSIAGWFVEQEQQKLGTMTLRNGSFKMIAFRQTGAYEGPVAVLVDDRSASTSEIFASGMQKSGRAKIFGQQTAGAALPSMIDVLPNGDRFLHAFAALDDLEGNPIEGIGVIPDNIVQLDRQSLATGTDPVIAAALQWISQQAKASEKE